MTHDTASPANRLIHETSPYLRQHAHNPVDWYAWGEEALQRARSEDKPIFLSIGYSACHWCHVMAHESFEDEQTAKLMNDLRERITASGMTQTEAAQRLGVGQSRVSDLMRGKWEKFSLEMLIILATKAGMHVTLKTAA